MRLLTIGVFARAAGLTPKALRLTTSWGVATGSGGSQSGYRLYDPASSNVPS